MNDRRKSQRESIQNITIKGNKVAKIIFYKSIALPVITFLLGICVLLYISIDGFLSVHTIKNQLSELKSDIKKIENQKRNLKNQNILINKKLAQVNTHVIDKDKVLQLIQKITNLLKLKHIVSDIKVVNIENDRQYQNVVNVSMEVFISSKYLNMDIVKEIISLVFGKILYIKDISLSGNQINIQIYKKVVS